MFYKSCFISMCYAWNLALCITFASTIACAQDAALVEVGMRDIADWDVRPEESKWWRIEDGMITGGSLDETVPYNTFIATEERFTNFEMVLKIRIQGTEGFINSGIQIRSIRVPDNSEMQGYQVDAGDGWWGKLYDESRRNQVIGEARDLKAVNESIKPNDWNEYRILANGPRLQTWINGVEALDYTEKDRSIPLDGQIGFQVHGGGKALVQIKDVMLRRLPEIAGTPKWKHSQALPLDWQEEQLSFSLPDGFTAELVAAETEDYGKFVALSFDSLGRLWTTTAMEYPVDANESPEASRALFERGGRDKVIVIDRPESDAPTVSVFADGLVMPLGVLPYRNGAFVQYGTDIRFYEDTDNDGRANQHSVILTGFGTQDSHLFPHQFMRTPDGTILTAQGLFNSSRVQRPGKIPFADGRVEIPFDHCKLARFAPDGSSFELLTAGPNNIWGLTISPEGEIWIQEANDIGYPIIPFEPGGYYATGSSDLLRSYQPLMPPPLGPPQMGGTGLSGLTLAADGTPWSQTSTPEERDVRGQTPKVFYVANPITSTIQRIAATFDGKRYRYSKMDDFLVSVDSRFRPVAISFGPDGSLYVVDWYNKIISHNEVPRNFPERDKTSGRIWRIRCEQEPRTQTPQLAKLPDRELISYLGNANHRINEFAWQEIVDRDMQSVVSELTAIVRDPNGVTPRRIAALWALEGLKAVSPDLLLELFESEQATIRYEAVRISPTVLSADELGTNLSKLINDDSSRVRASVGNALRRAKDVNQSVILAMMQLGKEKLASDEVDVWDRYDRDFERFQARWGMEKHSALVAGLLASDVAASLPLENRILAALSLDEERAAASLAPLITQLRRPLQEEELRVLVSHLDDPQVLKAVRSAVMNTTTRQSTLQALLRFRVQVNAADVSELVDEAAINLWDNEPTSDSRRLAMEVAGAFSLKSFTDRMHDLALNEEESLDGRRSAVRVLRELGTADASLLAAIMQQQSSDVGLRIEVLEAIAVSTVDASPSAVLELLEYIPFNQRDKVLDRLASSRSGASALAAAIDEGDIDSGIVSGTLLGKMRLLLQDDPTMDRVWKQSAAQLKHVLQLNGTRGAGLEPVDLKGPFTVEAWMKLAPRIGNEDSLFAADRLIDVNFYDGHFRVWLGNGQNDIVIAKTPASPDNWMHFAVTRDEHGIFSIYINGEQDAQSTTSYLEDLNAVRIGYSTSGHAGTAADIAEVRRWSNARSADEIRASFDRTFADEAQPANLLASYSGEEWGAVLQGAEVTLTLDAPMLISSQQAASRDEKFAKYRRLAGGEGNVLAGQAIFEAKCKICHQIANQGAKIGPPLDGVGLTGTEALLRNILTPNAAMEGGYRSYRVLTKEGQIIQGLLVSQDDASLVIRQPNTADVRLEMSHIEQGGFSTSSIMPEGIVEALQDQEVADLFTYLRSLSKR